MNCRSHILFILFCLFGIIAKSQNIEFIENKGQWDERVRYMGRINNGQFFIHKDGYTVLKRNPDDWERVKEHAHTRSIGSTELTVRSHAYRVDFVGASQEAFIEADKPIFTYNNYFIGNDPSKWASFCRIFQGITIKDIYPNIDLRYYTDKGTLKYDLVVRPGGKVSDIVLKYTGADRLRLKNKELIISTSIGELKELSPFTYQYNEKGRTEVTAKYTLKGDEVRFDIREYDPGTTLIIDPTLEFCSFTGSTAENWGFTATYGPDGSMFGGGIVGGTGFPITTGAFQQTYGGSTWDMGIIKLNATGTTAIYSTYIGGNGIEQPHSLICDPQGNLVIAGRTNSAISGGGAYPLTGIGLIGPGGLYDIVVTKLNATGSALIGSVRIGGIGNDGANITTEHNGVSPGSLLQNYGDDGRSEVNLDAAGNIYVASSTRTTNVEAASKFPTSPGAFQSTFGGGDQDGVLLKFNPNISGLLFSSYFGGSSNDAAYVVSVHGNGNIYIAGGTESNNLPGSTAGTIGASYNGGVDGYVSIISNNGSTVVGTTYLGTSQVDQVFGLQFDRLGFPYVMGQTRGSWPVLNAQWSTSNGRQFIAKLQPDLSAYVYSTVFGKSAGGQSAPDISPVAFLVDRCENVYVSGWGGQTVSGDFPNAGVQGLPVTSDALKPNPDINPSTGIGEDFYFFVLERNAVDQLYGTFFGQNSNILGDHVDGGTSRFDQDGVIYQAICASCATTAPFPTYPNPGVFAPVKGNGANCNLAMLKISFNLAGVSGNVLSYIDGRPRDTAGCVPLTVDFTDTVQSAVSYEWNFGDSPQIFTTTTPNISHTYTAVGSYLVMMVAIDSSTCNIRDTSYLTINVGDLRAILDFTPVKLDPCDEFRYRFDNISIAPPSRPFDAGDFIWDFGDNSPQVIAGPESVFHEYATPGTYTVMLILRDSVYCNYPDTLISQIRVAAVVTADFETPPQGCAPYNAVFNNTSLGGMEFVWDFGDNSPTSSDISPSHLYNVPGTYTVTLVAIDSATCNIVDTTQFTITVYGNPIANFSAAVQPPVTNEPIFFTNLSSPDATNFKWLFGDGDSLVTTSRDVIQHEYNATGTFTVCLIARNIAGCPDTLCRPVQTLIEPAVDVPTAFTPLQGGVNSVVYVRGFGIARMKFTVWARWGEKVFETNDKSIGWNGYFKGKLLPMDVYAYTLDVEFSDGTETTRTGDITLIR